MADDLDYGSIRIPPTEIEPDDEEAPHPLVGYDADPEHRYCTECVVTGDAIDRDRLRETLATMGSSLVVAGTARKTRLHIHVDQPEAVFAVAEKFGAVSARKADDMLSQTRTATREHAKVAVVTDTGADIPDDMLESLGIHIVPLRIQFGDHDYLDKVGITSEEFFERLATSEVHPQTSQPAPADYNRMFEYLSSHYEDVITVTVTRQVSGTWQAAVTAAERVERDRIRVLDTRNASLGQGLLAMEAARLAAAGVDADGIIERLRVLRDLTHSFAVTDDLSYAVKGGRIKGWMKRVGDLLRVTPILRNFADGRVSVRGALFGRPASMKRFAAYIARRVDAGKRYRVAVAYGTEEHRAVELANLLRQRIPHIEALYMTDVGAALGVHGGPKLVVAALQEVLPSLPGEDTDGE